MYMPSQAYYLKEEQVEFLDSLIEEDCGINNRSQAVQYCLNAQMQRGEL